VTLDPARVYQGGLNAQTLARSQGRGVSKDILYVVSFAAFGAVSRAPQEAHRGHARTESQGRGLRAFDGQEVTDGTHRQGVDRGARREDFVPTGQLAHTTEATRAGQGQESARAATQRTRDGGLRTHHGNQGSRSDRQFHKLHSRSPEMLHRGKIPWCVFIGDGVRIVPPAGRGLTTR